MTLSLTPGIIREVRAAVADFGDIFLQLRDCSTATEIIVSRLSGFEGWIENFAAQYCIGLGIDFELEPHEGGPLGPAFTSEITSHDLGPYFWADTSKGLEPLELVDQYVMGFLYALSTVADDGEIVYIPSSDVEALLGEGEA